MDARRARAERRGRRAERIAALWLWLHGYRILHRRYRTPMGEIDLVIRRHRALAFVEVKSRASLAAALEAITPGQRHRLERAARAYLARHPPMPGTSVRFDALVLAPGHWPRHLVNAWQPEGR
ncbi:MAG: YraN family protein [Rhodothalassiaceae bacterium]